MKKLMFALAAVLGFSAAAMAVETALDDAMLVEEFAVQGSGLKVQSEGDGGYKPDDKPDKKPDGEGGTGDGTTPPDKPSGGGTGGGGGGGATETIALTGLRTFDCVTNTLAGETLESTATNQNVILAKNWALLTVTNCALNKSGDTSSEDASNFFAVNAVVAAKTNAAIYIDHSTLNSNAEGANCLFASGEGSTIYAYDCTVTSTKDHSRGLDATYEGTVIASKLNIDTSGDHCAALATDRGNGYISATDSTLATAGQGSPLIYSTGIIEVNSVTGTATGAQIAGIEGLSTIRIRNSDLTGSGEKASEPVANGVIIYQSNSGDSTDGTATFEVSDSTLTSTISGGAMFYITHSAAFITVQDAALDFDADSNYLVLAAGNDGEHGWGTAGSNGAEVVFTAIDQKLAGNIAVDGISSVDLYLTNSTYTGTFEKDSTNAGDGEVNVFVSADSTWTVTSNCTLKTLTVAPGAKIVDSSGNTVRIVTDAETKVSGASDLTVIVSSYAQEDITATNTISSFEIDRTAFEEMYGTSDSEEDKGESGGSGGAQDHDGWIYYFKPHPPDNAIVKVKVAGAADYGTPDRDHKYCLDGYWDGDGENGVEVRLLYVTTEGYLFADGCKSNVWDVTITNNAQEVYPPEDIVAIKAQAKSGSTYYLTLKEAIDAGKKKITLNDNVTLEETLTVTNSITLNLNTNVVTLGSALTNAFCFTANATVSNGTINSSLTANAEGSVLLRFTDCKTALKDLTVNGRGYEVVVEHDSNKTSTEKYKKVASCLMTCDGLVLTGNGCLLSVDYANATLTNDCSFTTDSTFASFGGAHEAAVYCSGNGTITIADGTYASPKVLQSGDFGGKIVVNGGTFSGQICSLMAVGAHTELEQYDNYKAQFALNGGNYTDAAIAFAYADSFDLSVFTKGDGVSIAVPSGYAWEDNKLVRESATPGVASESYSDALTATNAATKINEDKSINITVPTGVEESLKETYLAKVEATVTSDNRIVVDLTPEAQSNEQVVVDAAVTNETVVASLVSTNAAAKATITTTTPGLYYWIAGGTDVNAVTNAGAGVLSTDGGSIGLSKPTLDAAKGKAFFRIAVGVAAPVQPNAD